MQPPRPADALCATQIMVRIAHGLPARRRASDLRPTGSLEICLND